MRVSAQDLAKTEKVNALLQQLSVDLQALPADKQQHTLAQTAIDPKNFGLFALVFEKVDLQVKGASDGKGTFMLEFVYSWDHPDSANGYTYRATSRDGGATWR